MTEDKIWKKIKPIFKLYGHACRHEDKITVGIPDISFGVSGINGWIELKAYNKWPQGIVKFDNFQSWQRRWLVNRGRSGGHCFVMLGVGQRKHSELLLFHWKKIKRLGKLNKKQLIALSDYYSAEEIDDKKFISIITKNT